MLDVYKFLKKAETYYLATVEDGMPRVRPFGTVNIFEGKLYIQTGKDKCVFQQLMANPTAEICGCYKGTWLRVSGKLVDDNRVEAKKSMLDAYPNLRGRYNENDDNTRVLYFQDAVAVFDHLDHREREVIHF